MPQRRARPADRVGERRQANEQPEGQPNARRQRVAQAQQAEPVVPNDPVQRVDALPPAPRDAQQLQEQLALPARDAQHLREQLVLQTRLNEQLQQQNAQLQQNRLNELLQQQQAQLQQNILFQALQDSAQNNVRKTQRTQGTWCSCGCWMFMWLLVGLAFYAAMLTPTMGDLTATLLKEVPTQWYEQLLTRRVFSPPEAVKNWPLEAQALKQVLDNGPVQDFKPTQQQTERPEEPVAVTPSRPMSPLPEMFKGAVLDQAQPTQAQPTQAKPEPVKPEPVKPEPAMPESEAKTTRDIIEELGFVIKPRPQAGPKGQ